MSRPIHALIHLDALRHNLRHARHMAPQSRAIAVIKADGYGHGAVRVAHALAADATLFAVASIDEALVLRQGGITQPLLLLEGPFEPAELPLCAEFGLQITIHHRCQIDMLERWTAPQALPVWLKLDSGMHRLGLALEHASEVYQRLAGLPAVAPGIRLMSHFACADERDNPFTRQQLTRLQQLGLPGEHCWANSAAVLAWPETHGDWIRPGIMLYGASPFAHTTGADQGLRPAMSLNSRLIAINRISRGEAIGYGSTWRCPETMDVGVVAAGYGDGYPRELPSGSPVCVGTRTVPLVGRVSMDMLSVDLRTHPGARGGDPVQLWGPQLPIERIAQAFGTIPYTLLTGVTARVPRQEQHG